MYKYDRQFLNPEATDHNTPREAVKHPESQQISRLITTVMTIGVEIYTPHQTSVRGATRKLIFDDSYVFKDAIRD